MKRYSPNITRIDPYLSGQETHPFFKPVPAFQNHEAVYYAEDPAIDFKAYIAVHSTKRGPSLGGARFRSDYKSNSLEPLIDALRLSQAMTTKNILAGLDLGGGKAVIIGRKGQEKPTKAQLKAFGVFVEHLEGIYVTAEDMNMSVKTLNKVAKRTKFVAGIQLRKMQKLHGLKPQSLNPAPKPNPAPYTALGTLMGIQAACQIVFQNPSVKGKIVAIKGAAGSVGKRLAKLLFNEGAKLIIADMDNHAVKQQALHELSLKYNARIVSSDDILTQKCDIYAPCATGGDISSESLKTMKAKIIAGAANNVLTDPSVELEALEKGIVYIPDFILNSGGVIAVGAQYLWATQPDRYDPPTDIVLEKKIRAIKSVILELHQDTKVSNVPLGLAALEKAKTTLLMEITSRA
jgi:leucine dehydrogenase